MSLGLSRFRRASDAHGALNMATGVRMRGAYGSSRAQPPPPLQASILLLFSPLHKVQ